MIQQKEEDVVRFISELASSKREREKLLKQITELQVDSDRLVMELNAQKSDRDWGQLARARYKTWRLSSMRKAVNLLS